MPIRYWFCLIFFLQGSLLQAQQRDTLVKKLDSLSHKTDSADGQVNNIDRAAYDEYTAMTPGSYFVLLGSDLKQAFTKPFHMHGRDWGLFGKYALATALLSLTDKPVQKQALEWRNRSATLQHVSSYVTNFGGDYEVILLGGLGLYGYAFKNRKMRTTTLLASQSYITSGVVSFTMKYVFGRQRPYVLNAKGEPDPHRFYGPFSKGPEGPSSNQSFPSGHTTAAFAAATVYALEYKNKPWVPLLTYSAAGLIGLSRITENKHWATDVLAGAALGYVCGRLVVNNYHRYAQLKRPGVQKGTVHFNIQYRFGVLQPGLVYAFR
jgi:membrane-associated phospholipid phosphatase